MKKSIQSTAELARHLGLSRWSVSRAINGQDGISSETAEQVRAAMAKFDFTPSPHARGLRGRRTGVIGVCFRELETRVTIQKIGRIQRLLSRAGYRPLFEFAEMDQQMGLPVIRHFIAMRVEAVLLVDMPLTGPAADWEKMLRKNAVPVATLEPLGVPTHNSVHLDREDAMQRVTEQLLKLGHERFALLGISRQFPLGRPRVDGVMRARTAHGLDARSAVIIDQPEHRYDGLRYGHELAERLLATARRPTALLALNDEVAAGALWRLQRAGLQCPRDFSLFGFDNLILSEQTAPSLCTVDHNVEDVASASVEMLLQLLAAGADKKLPVKKIAARIVTRDSLGKPSRGNRR